MGPEHNPLASDFNVLRMVYRKQMPSRFNEMSYSACELIVFTGSVAYFLL